MISCWIVTEGIAGTENQCIGVAEALAVTPDIKRINLRQPWKMLSPYLGLESHGTFTGDDLQAPWPDLVIASGRKAIGAARYIKKQSGGKSFVAVIQDPRVNPAQFDMVAVPEHDPTRGDNVIVTSAAPNKITQDKLTEAKKRFSSLLSPLPEPRIAVMIGGNSKAYTMTAEITRQLAYDLKTLAEEGYGLMVTASRRTGEENERIFKDALQHENIFYWDGSGENPYFGFLAWADYLLVTADSTSMISEAATTGKPVNVIQLKGGSRRLDLLQKNLLDKGIIRIFKGTPEKYNYEALNDAGLIAQEINKRLKKL